MRRGFLARLQTRSHRSVPDAESLGYLAEADALSFHLQNAFAVNDAVRATKLLAFCTSVTQSGPHSFLN